MITMAERAPRRTSSRVLSITPPVAAPAALLLGLAFVLSLAIAPPVAADWLVTVDGERIETDGPWEVKGRLLVFHRPDGTLASMRASEVDLEASEAYTRARQEETTVEPEPAERRPSVASLTEADLPPVSRERIEAEAAARAAGEGGEGGEDPAAAGSSASARSPSGPAIEVADWREVGNSVEGGVQIFGTLRNPARQLAVGVGVLVTLFDSEGNQVAQSDASVSSGSIPGGGSTNFRIRFPGVYAFDQATFQPRGNLLQTRGVDRPADPGDGEPPPEG